jgi:hypothetical protein
MKVYEMNFRDMVGQFLEIHGTNMVKILEKMGLHLDNLYGALLFGYIDHENGFVFEVLALETKKHHKIEYRIVPDDISCKIARFDVQDLYVEVLQNINIDMFKNKIEKIIEETNVNQALKELRAYKELDPSRHSEYPDDVMVYFLEEGKDPEACWVRLEGMKDGKLFGTLLSLPKQDFGLKEKDTVYFGMTDMEDKKSACVWTK